MHKFFVKNLKPKNKCFFCKKNDITNTYKCNHNKLCKDCIISTLICPTCLRPTGMKKQITEV